jgi:hypothetical protein
MKILLLLFMLSANAQAMDRWRALAMLESGGDDRTVGSAGEISRYQIRQELWPGGNPLDACVALANAKHIMFSRVAEFERSHGREPDDFEFYVLWNAPTQINHPHRVVAERARRFVNLVAPATNETNAFVLSPRTLSS